MGLNRRIAITPEQRDLILALLGKHLPDTDVWAYGSRVTGTSTAKSDLDLVVFTTPEQSGAVGQLREAFEESDLPFRVDLFVWDEVQDSFRERIEAEHAVIPFLERTSDRGVWRRSAMKDIVDLRLSSVDKKSNPDELAVRLCNYMDVYSNTSIHGDMDFMEATATEREIAKCALVADDVVITKDSEKHDDIGVPALVMEDVPDLVCGYHLAILRPHPAKVHGGYLVHALRARSVQHQFHAYANGVTRFGLRKADIGLVEVPLPPLSEQRAIAHVLGTLDNKIELNRRMNETLEAMARSLFESWFVDFDPVRAKMDGRDTGLPQHIADLFPARLVNSELGEIPEGWEMKSLDQVARFQNGLALQRFRPTENEARLPVVKIAQLRTGQANGSEWASTAIRPECIIKDGDIVFSWSGSLLIKVWCGGPAALNQHLFKVTSKRYPKWYYLHSLLSHLPEFRRIAQGKATTMGHIRRHHLADALCAVPPDDVIGQFSEIFRGPLKHQVANGLEVRTLTALRDALLPKLISGEIRVREAEEAVEAVV